MVTICQKFRLAARMAFKRFTNAAEAVLARNGLYGRGSKERFGSQYTAWERYQRDCADNEALLLSPPERHLMLYDQPRLNRYVRGLTKIDEAFLKRYKADPDNTPIDLSYLDDPKTHPYYLDDEKELIRAFAAATELPIEERLMEIRGVRILRMAEQLFVSTLELAEKHYSNHPALKPKERKMGRLLNLSSARKPSDKDFG